VNDLFDFEELRNILDGLVVAPEFSQLRLLGPRLSGKSKLIRYFAKDPRRTELVCSLDLKSVTGEQDVVIKLLAAARADELVNFRQQVHPAAQVQVTLQRSRLSRSSITNNNNFGEFRLSLAIATHLSEDLRRLRRPIVLLLDNSSYCTDQVAGTLESMIGVLRSAQTGTVIAEQYVPHEAIDSVMGGPLNPTTGCRRVLECLDSEAAIPVFSAQHVDEWAREKGFSISADASMVIASTTGGIAGVVEMAFRNVTKAGAQI
jgi:hypothetical protein